MAAVHLHNALFTPASPHAVSFSSRASVATSGVTSSDIMSIGPFVNAQRSSISYPERKQRADRRFQRSSRIWFHAMIALSFALLIWVAYSTIRYYVALRTYGGDAVRSRYALGMGIASTFSMLFFSSKTLLILWHSDGRSRRRFMLIFHSLAYLSSVLVMSLAVINLILVLRWRLPHGPADSGRSIKGRCNWDLDVVWSGTGGACDGSHAMPFGHWLGAAIFRLVITAVLLVAYHLSIHGHLAAARSHDTLPAMIFAGVVDDGHTTLQSSTMDELRLFGSSGDSYMCDSSPETLRFDKQQHATHDVETSVQPLSFTEAGEVLSRIEGSESDIEDREETAGSSSNSSEDLHDPEDPRQSRGLHHVSVPRSESPEPMSSSSAPQPSHVSRHWYTGMDPHPINPPPSSFHRPITPSSNDLQDFASAFRGLISRISRETQEGLALHHVPEPRERDTVHVLGSWISRMSTIESMASREVSNSIRSPSRSETAPSLASGSLPPSHPGSRSLSRNTTLNRGREREETTESPLSSSPET